MGHINEDSDSDCICSRLTTMCLALALSLLYLFQSYYNVFGTGTEPVVYLSINAFIAGMFAVGLATGVVLAVGGLLCIQVRQSLDVV